MSEIDVSEITGSSLGRILTSFSFWQTSQFLIRFSILHSKFGILYRSLILWYIF